MARLLVWKDPDAVHPETRWVVQLAGKERGDGPGVRWPSWVDAMLCARDLLRGSEVAS